MDEWLGVVKLIGYGYVSGEGVKFVWNELNLGKPFQVSTSLLVYCECILYIINGKTLILWLCLLGCSRVSRVERSRPTNDQSKRRNILR